MSAIKKEVVIGNCRLILGDCLEVLPILRREVMLSRALDLSKKQNLSWSAAGNRRRINWLKEAVRVPVVDAVVTDPPYGIGESAKKNNTRGKVAKPRDYGSDDWDQSPASPAAISWMRQNSRWQIIFGGNYFDLPPSRCWLVWDKESTGDFADCELAWTNLDQAVRRIRWMWNGMLRKGSEERFHLTQKPVGVMTWCLGRLPDGIKTILDPYAGSGTTGVACVAKGLGFTGIERELHHFETMVRRIAEAHRQLDAFQPIAPAKVEQTSVF